jgi:pre-rRNA-processing protein TSR4
MAPPTPSAPVLLGFAGRMVGGGERLDHRTTKIGGVPDWPPSAAAAADGDPDGSLLLDPAAPPAEMTACARCGETMALVAQAHAPLVSGELPDGAAVADRVLYLFSCFSETCPGAGANAGRWRCLRAQVPPVAAPALDDDSLGARVHGPSTVPATEVEGAVVGEVADDWGGAGGDDWGAGAGDDWGAASGDAADAEALASALDSLATRDVDRPVADTGGRFPRAENLARGDGSELTPRRNRLSDWRGPRLPEFYLVADYEPDAASASALTSAERADAERLLHKYAVEEGLETDPANAAAAIAAAVTDAATHSENRNAAEAYESAAVEGVDGRYLKFSKRVRRAPEQCVRYAFGGHALCWPEDGPGPEKTCAPCERCGASRRAELQLVPPLLHFAAEAAEWLGASTYRSTRTAPSASYVSADAVDAWDWQAVVAMTCSRSCGPEDLVPNEAGSERSAGFSWFEERVASVDGDGGVAELLKSGQTFEVPERDVVVSERDR